MDTNELKKFFNGELPCSDKKFKSGYVAAKKTRNKSCSIRKPTRQ